MHVQKHKIFSFRVYTFLQICLLRISLIINRNCSNEKKNNDILVLHSQKIKTNFSTMKFLNQAKVFMKTKIICSHENICETSVQNNVFDKI